MPAQLLTMQISSPECLFPNDVFATLSDSKDGSSALGLIAIDLVNPVSATEGILSGQAFNSHSGDPGAVGFAVLTTRATAEVRKRTQCHDFA